MSKTSYVYNVQLLVEDEHHASALAQLLSKLNTANFLDYKIVSGIELGGEIDDRINKATSKTSIPMQNKETKKTKSPSSSVTSTESELKSDPNALNLDIFRQFKSKNTLIRLIINRGLGIKASIPCRVINIDESEAIITVYHVDEKQVYTFRLFEIDDFIES